MAHLSDEVGSVVVVFVFLFSFHREPSVHTRKSDVAEVEMYRYSKL